MRHFDTNLRAPQYRDPVSHPRGAQWVQLTRLVCQLGGKDILRGVTGKILSGKVTAILGPNGCGKTTLLRALLGLVPLTNGLVESIPDIKGYLPQKKEIYWPLTCEAIINLGSTSHEPRAANNTDQILNRFSIAHLRDKRIDEVSGGERTLVLLARALRDKPTLIVADEPVSELDPKYQVEVMRILKEEATRGATVVVTMHDIQLTARFADHVFLMKEGRVFFQGNTSSVLSAKNLEDIFGIHFMEEKGFYAR